jgi:shikimate kinase
MKAVALVGFMGAGKTTVGRALAERIGWRFEDLDDLIQTREGLTIEQIFSHRGEPAFRDLEHVVLRETIANENPEHLVLALGGGAFVASHNQELLRAARILAVFLDAPAEELFRRCEQPGINRPNRRDRETFSELYERRRPAYMNAGLCIDTYRKTIASVVEEITSALQLGVSE